MTNYENIVTMKPDELAHFLCTFLDYACAETDVHPCDLCPAKKTCYRGHNGFKDWLNKEAE